MHLKRTIESLWARLCCWIKGHKLQSPAVMGNRAMFCKGLRDLADFLEANDRLPLPSSYTLTLFIKEKSEFLRIARSIGHAYKSAYGDFYNLEKHFGPIQFDLTIERQLLCDAVVVGKKIIPAKPAEPEKEVDEIEWKCPELLREAQ